MNVTSVLRLLVGALVLSGLAAVVPTAPSSATVALTSVDVAYGSNSFRHMTITYARSRHDAPWVMLVHGGSWIHGDRASMAGHATVFARHGFQAFNVEYDRGTTVTLAEQVRDLRAAKAWIERHAAKYGVNPRRGVLFGFSAGGNLASLLAMGGDPRIRAVVTAEGIVQPQRLAHPATDEMARLYQREVTMMGCEYAGDTGTDPCSRAWRRFIPQDWISSSTPPFYVVNGDADPKQPWQGAKAFVYWLHEAHRRATLVIVPGGTHTSNNVMDGGAQQRAMFRWVAARLG